MHPQCGFLLSNPVKEGWVGSGAREWRDRMCGEVEAGLIRVNLIPTAGHAQFSRLKKQCTRIHAIEARHGFANR